LAGGGPPRGRILVADYLEAYTGTKRWSRSMRRRSRSGDANPGCEGQPLRLPRQAARLDTASSCVPTALCPRAKMYRSGAMALWRLHWRQGGRPDTRRHRQLTIPAGAQSGRSCGCAAGTPRGDQIVSIKPSRRRHGRLGETGLRAHEGEFNFDPRAGCP
jgi:hypothetical protein